MPGGGSQEQADFIQELEFAMQGPRRDASEPGDLTHIEGFVGTKQQQSEDLPAIGAEQDLHQLRLCRQRAGSHIENECSELENIFAGQV